MANSPFDREVWNLYERALADDNNIESSYADLALRTILDRLTTPRASITDFSMQTTPPPAFAGDGLKVVAQSPAAMAVNVTAGQGFIGDTGSLPTDIGGIPGVNDVARLKPVTLSALQTFVVPANASGLTRVDIVELVYRRAFADSTSRDIMALISPFVFTPTLVNKTLTWDLAGQTGTVTSPASSTAALSYKIGVAGAGTPATTAGYTKVAEITVISGAASIAQTDILDTRRGLALHGLQRLAITIVSQPVAGTHTITALTAAPGVEVSVADNGSTIDLNYMTVTVKPGKVATNVVATFSMANFGTPVFSWLGDIITSSASSFVVKINGAAVSPIPAAAGVVTVGTQDLDAAGDVYTYITIDYQQ